MLERKIRGYQKRFKKYGVDPRSLQYWSKKWADLRYRQLVEDIDFEGKTILDVGCGFGDIIPHIEKKTKDFGYTGVDLVPEFIEVCKQKYPKHIFKVCDYFGKPLEKKFDIILSSGTLNANIKDPYEYRKKAIKTMFNHAKEVAVFNMTGAHPQPKNMKGNRVYYADSQIIVEFCLTLTKKLILRQDYHPRDFTIVMFK